VLDDPEILALALPALESDTRLSAQFRPQRREPLDCPVYALRGREDPRVSAQDMLSWAKETTNRFVSVEVPCGHVVQEAASEVSAIVLEHLRADGLW